MEQAAGTLNFVKGVSFLPEFAKTPLWGFWLFLFCVISFPFAGGAEAATLAVVLSDSSAPYQETADAIESGLAKEHTVVRILVSHLDQSETALSNARLIVTVGVKAAQEISGRHGRTPVLAILIPRAWYEADGKSVLVRGGRIAGAIFIDQPFTRQFHLIKSALPSVNKVGVVLGKQGADQLPELDRQAKAHGMALSSAILTSDKKLVETLENVLGEADILLLAFPDANVLSRTTAQSVFMTSYRFRDPVVGYSESLSRAGALLTVYSTPVQIGRQAAEIIEKSLDGGKLPAAQWPQYFSVSVNEHVARSLDISVPPEAVLMKRVQDAESHD